MDTSLLLKMKGRLEIFLSEPESKFPKEANSDILGFLLNQTTHSGVLSFCLQSGCVRQTSPSQNAHNELVKTFALKRLQIITGKIGRDLIIFFKIRVAKTVWEGVFVNSCTFQRVANSQ